MNKIVYLYRTKTLREMGINTIETMKVVEGNHLLPVTGKLWVRISDGYEAGKEVFLGKTWYLGGQELDEPIDELPEHYMLIDDPYKYDEEGNRIYEEPIIEEEPNYEEIE